MILFNTSVQSNLSSSSNFLKNKTRGYSSSKNLGLHVEHRQKSARVLAELRRSMFPAKASFRNKESNTRALHMLATENETPK